MTLAPTSMVRLPSAMAVQWKNQRPPAVVGDHPPVAGRLVELVDRATVEVGLGHQCTIFEIGSSMMSVAPWSRNAGMSTLMSDLGTTVSTA